MKFLNKRCLMIHKNWKKHVHEACSRRELSSAVDQTSESTWKPTIGLEVHAQIATESKLFSGACTRFVAPVNSCVSLFDCATPGTMPVLNRKCVEAGVITALALSCKVNEISLFERKHYYYADLPAGFQITQHKQPLAVDGEVIFHVALPHLQHAKTYSKTAKIKQLQLEQDSGRTWQDERSKTRLIDLNRSGIPLMEIVFEPDLHDGEEAAALVKELILILQLLGTCSCKIEEGALRIDANISVSRPNDPLGMRTEIKNIGSVRAVASAIKYETNRQISVLEGGGVVFNETRAWDAKLKKTIPMRQKEEKLDYRFMPETNLPPLHVRTDESIESPDDLVDAVSLKQLLPELPEETRSILRNTYNLSPTAITQLMSKRELLNLFLKITSGNQKLLSQKVANFLITDLVTFLYETNLDIDACMQRSEYIGKIIDLKQSELITSQYAMKLLNELIDETGKTAVQIVEENNWYVISDRAQLEEICSAVINEYPKLVKKYKNGQTKALHSLIGYVLKSSSNRVHKHEVIGIMENLLR